MSCITITSDGIWAEQELPESDQLLDFLQGCVGGWVEAHDIAHIGGVTIWMNEEGAIHGLPENPIASSIWTQEHGFGRILGDIVLTGSADEQGDTTGLNPQQLTTIKERYLHE